MTEYLEGLSQRRLYTTLYYEDGRVETIEHDKCAQPHPSKACPKVVTGRTTRVWVDIEKIEDRTRLLPDD